MFVPRILINMAAGHLTMKYGFQVYNLRGMKHIRLYNACHRAQIMLYPLPAQQVHILLEMP